MFTAKIGVPTKENLQADNSEYLNVPVDILDEDGTVVETRNTGYPLDTDPEMIKADTQAMIDLYNVNVQRAKANAAHNAIHAIADETIIKLTDTVVDPNPAAISQEE